MVRVHIVASIPIIIDTLLATVSVKKNFWAQGPGMKVRVFFDYLCYALSDFRKTCFFELSMKNYIGISIVSEIQYILVPSWSFF